MNGSYSDAGAMSKKEIGLSRASESYSVFPVLSLRTKNLSRANGSYSETQDAIDEDKQFVPCERELFSHFE